MTLKILLESLLIAAVTSSVLSSSEDHHRVLLRSHRIVLPVWNHDRLYPRHDHLDDERIVRETTTTTMKNPWMLRPQVSMTRLSQQINSGHIEQRMLEQKFNGAVAMTENGGTRAIAYAGYHGNHRHQPREMGTQSFQPISTTVPTYTRHHSGRRVCNRQAPAVSHHHRGKQLKAFYKLIYFIEFIMTSNFFCCPGWSQVTHLSFGCNKHVDECVIEKPCGQLCTNLPGRYRCHCRVGFQLQEDGQSCRRNDTDENAFEARDLEIDDMSATKDPTTFHDTENEVSDDDQDYEVILKRLIKLEKQVARNRKRDTEASEMNTKVTLAIESVNEMKRTVENVQLMQQEVYDMRSKMRQYEAEMRKIHHLMNRVAELENRLRIRCRYQ
ncbi:MEGF6 protein, partial [Acromyrmex charruanus]